MLKYHHCRNLNYIGYCRIWPSKKAINTPKEVYEWLKEAVGFYPVFLAVGTERDDIRITGYQLN